MGTTFEEKLLKLRTKDELIISEYYKYGFTSNQFTYIIDVHSTTSWLNYIICSFDFCSLASDVVILDKLPSSEHLPGCCRIRFKLVFDVESRDLCDNDVKVNSMSYHWCKASDAEIEQYRIVVTYISNQSRFPVQLDVMIILVFVRIIEKKLISILVIFVKH